MFLGLQWYWWVIIAVILVVAIPLKVVFVRWWSRRHADKTRSPEGKWGDEE